MKTKLYFLILLLCVSNIYAQSDLTKLDSLVDNYKQKYIYSSIETQGLDVFTILSLDSLSLDTRGQDDLLDDTKGIIYESSLNFAGEFSLAKSMADVAGNMKIFEEDEAHKIDELTKKGEKVLNTTADVVSILGGVASVGLLISNEDVSKGTQFSVNLAAIIPQLIKSINKKKNENKKIDEAIDYAHTKAARLSINAYLSIEMKSVSQTLESIKVKSIAIKNKAKGELNTDEVKKLSKEYISLVESIDRFYNFDLVKLKSSISDRSYFQIYPEYLQIQLDNLALSIAGTNELWQERRFNFLESIDVLKTYIE